MSGAPLPVVVNRSGGTAAALGDTLEAKLREAFGAAGRDIDLHLPDGPGMAAALARVAGAPVVAVGGGDGTQGQAAGVLAKAGSALAILPLGTRNHLARQLGIPLELEAAARVAVTGTRTRIDLARAGDRVFVNNASAGLYVRLVSAREAVGGPKWLATIPAALHVLRHLRERRVRLTIDGQEQIIKTPLLFVGNNRYSFAQGSVGERESVTGGKLSLYALAPKSAGQLVWFSLRAMLGRADLDRDFATLSEATKVVVGGQGTARIAFDGEVERVCLPLEFAILPGALEVLVP